jgi:predicted ATPase/DNA-binding CsgD family transcriptional regulator
VATQTVHDASQATWLARTRAPLVPRDRELFQIVSLLAPPDRSLVTLVGPPGAGKTTLALMAGDSAASEFRDGVWFVDLSVTRDSAQVVQAIAATLGIADDANEHDLAAALQRVLHGRRSLLILDNFEQVLAARSVVHDLLGACSHLKMLVTSRAPLQLSFEQQCLVPPLPLPRLDRDLLSGDFEDSPAVMLFKLRAQAVNASWELTRDEAPTVAELCFRLDGLPLAIELAASWVAIMPVASILDQLSHTLDLLVSHESDRPQRHQTLRAAIQWSEDLLPPEAQVLFRRLAVFTGSCTLAAAEAVCEDHVGHPSGLVPPLRVLADHHLIAASGHAEGPPRFGMLQTIHEYALERLRASGEVDAIRQRHASYFAGLVPSAEREYHTDRQSAWLDRIEEEYENLRGVLDWCAASSDAEFVELGMELAAGLWFYWTVRGHIREGRERLQQVLHALLAKGRSRARAQALTAIGWLAWFNSDAHASFGPLEEGLSIWRELGDEAGAARALAIIGLSLAVYTDDLARARETLEEASALSDATDEPWARGYSAYGLGHLAAREGASAEALVKFEQSLAIRRSTGNHWGVGYSLYRLSLVALAHNDIDRATELQYQSLATSWELRNKRGMAVSTEVLACLAGIQGRAERAARLFGVAQALLDAANYVLPPTLSQLHQRAESAARSDLGARAFATAVHYGRTMPLPEGVAYALADYGVSSGRQTLARSSAPYPGLSHRELEIVRLVAQGFTDKQIADELHISPRTVDGHLRRIFVKVGVTSRSALTAWGIRHLGSMYEEPPRNAVQPPLWPHVYREAEFATHGG